MRPELRESLQGLMEEMKAWCLLPPAKTDQDLEQLGSQARDFQKRLNGLLKEMEADERRERWIRRAQRR